MQYASRVKNTPKYFPFPFVDLLKQDLLFPPFLTWVFISSSGRIDTALVYGMNLVYDNAIRFSS